MVLDEIKRREEMQFGTVREEHVRMMDDVKLTKKHDEQRATVKANVNARTICNTQRIDTMDRNEDRRGYSIPLLSVGTVSRSPIPFLLLMREALTYACLSPLMT